MLVAGIMSGTSADGIDVALVEINGRGWNTRFHLRAHHSFPYPVAVRRRILSLAGGVRAGGSMTGSEEIAQLNFLLGELFAKACIGACRRSNISTAQLQLIGSHGQTIFHQGETKPFLGASVASTLQIGESAVIAERTGVTTVADFRPADMAAGGAGAPLIPFFDFLLFRSKRNGRVALNIGGIANLTALPAGASDPAQLIAFDTGPGNMLLDSLASILTRGKQTFDRGGRLATQGRIDETLVKRLLRQRYFHQPPPRTAGREQFGSRYLERFFLSHFGRGRQRLLDSLATATAFTAETIADAIATHVVPRFPVTECFISGGGVRNRFLMEQLQLRLDLRIDRCIRAGTAASGQSRPVRILSSDAAGIPPQAKEAVAFALLAYQTIHHRPSNLPAATGAEHAAVLGKVCYADR